MCQCCKLPFAFTLISTFLVTPGPLSGLHFTLVVGIGSSIFVFNIYDCFAVNTLNILIDPSPHPAAMYLSLGSNLTQKVRMVRSPRVYL